MSCSYFFLIPFVNRCFSDWDWEPEDIVIDCFLVIISSNHKSSCSILYLTLKAVLTNKASYSLYLSFGFEIDSFSAPALDRFLIHLLLVSGALKGNNLVFLTRPFLYHYEEDDLLDYLIIIEVWKTRHQFHEVLKSHYKWIYLFHMFVSNHLITFCLDWIESHLSLS
jgi:hypothetical protein